MAKKELNELEKMIKEIENMNLSSKKDALNIKRAMMNLLRKVTVKYQTLSLEQQNDDINAVIPEIVSIFAQIQGTDIICSMGAEKSSVTISGMEITEVEHSTDNAMETIHMFNQLYVYEDEFANNDSFTSKAQAIVLRK